MTAPAGGVCCDARSRRAYVPLLLERGRYASTLINLAAILYAWAERDLAILLLKKYVRTVTTIAPAKRLWRITIVSPISIAIIAAAPRSLPAMTRSNGSSGYLSDLARPGDTGLCTRSGSEERSPLLFKEGWRTAPGWLPNKRLIYLKQPPAISGALEIRTT